MNEKTIVAYIAVWQKQLIVRYPGGVWGYVLSGGGVDFGREIKPTGNEMVWTEYPVVCAECCQSPALDVNCFCEKCYDILNDDAVKDEREACKKIVASLVDCGMGDAWDAGFNSAKEQAISKIHERGHP